MPRCTRRRFRKNKNHNAIAVHGTRIFFVKHSCSSNVSFTWKILTDQRLQRCMRPPIIPDIYIYILTSYFFRATANISSFKIGSSDESSSNFSGPVVSVITSDILTLKKKKNRVPKFGWIWFGKTYRYWKSKNRIKRKAVT
jgi:hypothetical protein